MLKSVKKMIIPNLIDNIENYKRTKIQTRQFAQAKTAETGWTKAEQK